MNNFGFKICKNDDSAVLLWIIIAYDWLLVPFFWTVRFGSATASTKTNSDSNNYERNIADSYDTCIIIN